MHVSQNVVTVVSLTALITISILAFQNCAGGSTSFKEAATEEIASTGVSPDPSPTPLPSDDVVATLVNKSLSFYGTRVNGQLALVAQISAASTVPLTISLTKSCGSLMDSQILGNGSSGQFVFNIPVGQTISQPVILSAFPSGQIVWKVNVIVTGSNLTVTDLIQSCSPWLQSSGEPLCPAPNNQPYCKDRG